MGVWQLFFIVLCAAGGAALCVMPFLLEYRLLVKLAETQALAEAANPLRNLEQISKQIGSATSQWAAVQEEAGKTAAEAKQINERMNVEATAFKEFLQRANDNEKATLRLEIEKLRRGEGEWIQVMVRILDHVHAVHLGAMRSGQPRLMEQITNFQAACHDAARRIGLALFVPAPQEAFDPERHQLTDAEAKPAGDALIEETLAAGVTYQGRLLRPALVRLQDGKDRNSKSAAENQSDLPLETSVP